ncbi:MAG: hypothetical protein GH148_07715 [Clostridia bacterium]|nr:hypothetical protein [Clostridia bacterium]
MKITFITNHYYPEISIASNRMQDLINYFKLKGYEVSLIDLSERGKVLKDRIKESGVYRIIPNFLKVIYRFYEDIKIIRRIKNTNISNFNNSVIYISLPPIFLTIFVRYFNDNNILVAEYRDVVYRSELIRKENGYLVAILMNYFDKKYIKYYKGFVFLNENIKKHYSLFLAERNEKINNGLINYNWFVKGNIPKKSYSTKGSNVITIVYAGSFYGSRVPFEIFNYFENQIKLKIFFKIYGKMTSDIKGRIKMMKLDYIKIKIFNFLPRDELIDVISKSSANLLITHKYGSEYAIPGKLFDYIGARRPIIAFSNDPLVRKIIKDYNLGICLNRNIDEISLTETKYLGEYLANINRKKIISNVVNKFSYNYRMQVLEKYLVNLRNMG